MSAAEQALKQQLDELTARIDSLNRLSPRAWFQAGPEIDFLTMQCAKIRAQLRATPFGADEALDSDIAHAKTMACSRGFLWDKIVVARLLELKHYRNLNLNKEPK